VDILRVLGGDVKSVYAKISRAFLNIEVEDTGVAIVNFKNGITGIIEATNAARPENLEASISVLGENGSIVIGGACMNKVSTWSLKDYGIEQDCEENPPNIYGYGHEKLYEQIYKDIKNKGTGDIVDGEDALANIRLVNCIYESAETGNEIFIDSDCPNSRLGK